MQRWWITVGTLLLAAVLAGSPLQAQQLPKGEDVHVLFVGGYLNEMLLNYFWHNKSTLKDYFGVENIHELYPSSLRGIPEGAEKVYQKVLEIRDVEKRSLMLNGWTEAEAQKQVKPVIIVGHSLGAAETLYALLKHPDLVENGHVLHAVLIQGAIGGSPLSDLGMNLSSAHSIPKSFVAVDSLISKIAKMSLLTAYSHMVRPVAKKLFKEVRDQLSESQRKQIGSRVYYVRSTQLPSKQSSVLYVYGLYLQEFFGANDGMLLLEDQRLDGIGRDLMVLDADHADLVAWGRHVTNSDVPFKREFTKSVFQNFLQPAHLSKSH